MNFQKEKIATEIVDAAFQVHKELGPGLLESVYQVCMERELRERNIFFLKQVFLPVIYKGETLDADFRIDLLVADEIVVELKSVEVLLPVHEAQLLTYLKLSEKHLGFLINFNVPLIKNGIKRMLNGFEKEIFSKK
jgi:GxxExxY protein